MTTVDESPSLPIAPKRPGNSVRKWDWIAFGMFFLALFACFSPLVLAREALFYFDITEINYAYRHFFAENLKAGRLTFWCHRLYNGLPLFAESQAGYLHPLKFLFYPWMSTWAALGYDMVASLALTGLGTYVWLRRHAHPSGALAGSFIATFGGFTWAHFVHTSMINALAAVPWIIWGVERTWRTGRFGGAAVAAFALATQVFAGHLQDALMSLQLIGVMTLYAIAVNRTSAMRRRVLGAALLVGIGGVGIAAVQWLPSYDLLKRTPRTEGLDWADQTFGSWHPQLLPTLFVREAYGTRARDTDWMDGFYPYHEMNAYLGLTALMTALLGTRRWRDPWVGLWCFVGFVSVLFMLGRFTMIMDFWHKIPILGSSRIPVRYHLWATFATAALASQGIDRLVSDSDRVKFRGILVVLGMFALAATGIFAWTMTPWWTEAGRWTAYYHQERNQWLTDDLIRGTIRSLVIFSVGIVLANAAARSVRAHFKASAAMLTALLIGIDLIAAHWNDSPTVDPSFWTKPPAAVSIVRADPYGGRVMGVARYSAGEPGFASTSVDFFPPRDALGWSLPLAYGLESNVGETPFRPARLIRLTDLAGGEPWRFSIEGVTHLVTGQPIGASMMPQRADSAYVYRLPDPEPRFHWARTVQIVPDDVRAEDAMKRIGAASTTGVVVVEAPADQMPGADETEVAEDWTNGIDVVEAAGDRLRSNLETATDRWLRLGISYDPGWRAWIDGVEVSVRPAQLAFMAIRVPAGSRELVMRYEPVGLRLGASVAFISSVVLAIWVGLGRRRRADCRPGEFEDDSVTPVAFAPISTACLLAILMIVSAVALSPDGNLGISSRWNDSWHRFTWGAGIEAMNR